MEGPKASDFDLVFGELNIGYEPSLLRSFSRLWNGDTSVEKPLLNATKNLCRAYPENTIGEMIDQLRSSTEEDLSADGRMWLTYLNNDYWADAGGEEACEDELFSSCDSVSSKCSWGSLVWGAYALLLLGQVGSGAATPHSSRSSGPGRGGMALAANSTLLKGSVEVEDPHSGEKRGGTVDKSSNDLLCRHLMHARVGQEFITLRTSSSHDISRAYRETYGTLGLRPINSSFNGSCLDASGLQKKLQGLKSALINREAMLIDGPDFRPCIHKGKEFLATEGAQKRDLIARTNDFNHYYTQCSGKSSLFPSDQMVKSSKSAKFSKYDEMQEIVDQLEKIAGASQTVSLAKNTRKNRSPDCQQMGVVQLPRHLKQLVDEKGVQWVTQVAYQSLSDDLTDLVKMLKVSLSKGAEDSIQSSELEYLRVPLDTLNAALKTRQKFLAGGEYFKPCTTMDGQPLLATDREQREHLAFMIYNVAHERDVLLCQHGSLLDSDRISSSDAFFTRLPVRIPETSGEARQVIPLMAKIKKINGLIEDSIRASEGESRVRPSSASVASEAEYTVMPSSPCPLRGYVPLTGPLKRLVNEKGVQLAAQVAYQSLHDDLTDLVRILRTALSKGAGYSIQGSELEYLKNNILDSLNIDLNTRKMFLTGNCTTINGQSLSDGNQEQIEHLVFLSYSLASGRDKLLRQNRGLLDSKLTLSTRAFFTRMPAVIAGGGGEARQIILLMDQVEEINSLIKDEFGASEGKYRVSPSAIVMSEEESTVKPSSPGGRSEGGNTVRTSSTKGVLKRRVEIPHNVAVIYLKDQAKAARFDINTLQDRIVNQVDALIRSNSYHKEGFGTVAKFGWYDIDSGDWGRALNKIDYTNLTLITQAKKQGSLNLDNFDYIISVWDDTQ
nr:hypothetical protein [Endozoicomonas sp.]